MTWKDKLLGRKAGATVVVQQVIAHGADLLDVRGTVDGVPVRAFIPVAELDADGVDRRGLAAALARRKPAPVAPPTFVGREEGV